VSELGTSGKPWLYRASVGPRFVRNGALGETHSVSSSISFRTSFCANPMAASDRSAFPDPARPIQLSLGLPGTITSSAPSENIQTAGQRCAVVASGNRLDKKKNTCRTGWADISIEIKFHRHTGSQALPDKHVSTATSACECRYISFQPAF